MRRLLTLAVLSFSLLALAACGGGGSDTPSNVLTPIPGDMTPLLLNEFSVVGDNRFVVGLTRNSDNQPVVGATMHLRFFTLNANNEGTLKFEADPEAITVTKSYTHTHPDGLVESHPAGETGAYVTHVAFDAPGNWGVEVTGTAGDEKLETVRLSFPVEATDPGIGVGTKIPASVQPVLSDVTDIKDIDTSVTPIPEQHELTVAQAIANGKPTVIAFATPAFCLSQVCGPAKDLFDVAYQQYKDEVNFVHIEPYDVKAIRAGTCTNYGDCLAPAAVDFKLRSEPWVFVADSQGILRAKFDGIFSEDELLSAVQAVASSATPTQ